MCEVMKSGKLLFTVFLTLKMLFKKIKILRNMYVRNFRHFLANWKE